MDGINLRSNIGNLIDASGYRRGWVAQQVDVSRPQLAKWSAGTSYPTVPKAFALARLLGVRVDDLYSAADTDE
jgi:DNA-binding XRE family transcriptional regulator